MLRGSLITSVCTLLLCVSVNAQTIGKEDELDLGAKRLFSRNFSVLGEWRIDTTLNYITSDKALVFQNTSTRQLRNTTSITAALTPRSDLLFGVTSLFQHSKSASLTPDGIEEMKEEHAGLQSLTVGARYTLTTEGSTLPELILLANAGIPIGMGSIDGGHYAVDVGLGAIKTLYPAYLFASISVGASLKKVEPFLAYRVGLAFALNDRLNLGFLVEGKTETKAPSGLLGESSVFALRATYALGKQWYLEGSVGFGLSEESPNRIYTVNVGKRIKGFGQ